MGTWEECLSFHLFTQVWCSSYGSHTFKMVNSDGEAVYCKFHYKSDQGIRTFTRQEADEMAKSDPDFAIRNVEFVHDRSGWYCYFQGPLQRHRLWRLPYLDNVHPGDDLPGGGKLGVQSFWSDKGTVWIKEQNIFGKCHLPNFSFSSIIFFLINKLNFSIKWYKPWVKLWRQTRILCFLRQLLMSKQKRFWKE